MRFREDTPAEQARARDEVAAWREHCPQGTPDEMLAAIGCRFHRDYGPVLRAALEVLDRHAARQVTGVIPGRAGAAR